MKQIGITAGTAQVQKTVLLGTARILRKIENAVVVKSVYSGIFMHIHGHLAMFSHVQAY